MAGGRARRRRGPSVNNGSEEMEKKSDGHDEDQEKVTGEANEGATAVPVLTPSEPSKSKTPRTPEQENTYKEKEYTETLTGGPVSSIPPVESRPNGSEATAVTVQLQKRKEAPRRFRGWSQSMETVHEGQGRAKSGKIATSGLSEKGTENRADFFTKVLTGDLLSEAEDRMMGNLDEGEKDCGYYTRLRGHATI